MNARPRIRSARRGSVTAGLALTIAVLLGGCVADSSFDAATSKALQDTVVTAADQVSAGDPASALATLDALQAQLDQAKADVTVSAERAARIQQALDQVRADLQPAPATEPEPAPETDPETDPGTEPEPEPAEPAPAPETEPAPTPSETDPAEPSDPPTTDPEEGDEDGEGNGNGNGGNGNGNGGGNGNGNGGGED